MWDLPPLLNSALIAVLGALLAAFATWFFGVRSAEARARERIADATAKQDARIVELEKSLAMVGASVAPISLAFQAILVKELTRDEEPEMDWLLIHIGELTAEQAARLEIKLQERAADPGKTQRERDAAVLLPLVMKRVISDLNEPLTLKPLVQAVTLPPEKKPPHEPFAVPAG